MNSTTQIRNRTAVTPRDGVDHHTGVHWAAGLAVVAGTIQLSLAWIDGLLLFVLPAAVLFAGVAIATTGANGRSLYALGVAFVVAQLFAALMQHLPTLRLGVLAIVVQVALLGVLAYLLWREGAIDRSRNDGHRSSY